MKRIIVAFTSSIIIFACASDRKDRKELTIPIKNDFISQRHLHEKTFGDLKLENEYQWDSLNNISHDRVSYKKRKIHPDVMTFGWHLYSNGSSWKNYNFSMLWGISYFSYSIQPETGKYKSIHEWKTTALIDTAKANGCKVFLSVSNFGSDNNAIFLGNPKAQETLIDSLSRLLALRRVDGINIDFEGVPKNNKNDLTKFILKVSKRLKQDNPEYLISLCLYAEDWNDIFDIKAIDSYVDFYTLMGYDYYGSFSKTTGPVTPFKNSEKFGSGLKQSVSTYEKKGVHLGKLIIGLPYYGAEWYTRDS